MVSVICYLWIHFFFRAHGLHPEVLGHLWGLESQVSIKIEEKLIFEKVTQMSISVTNTYIQDGLICSLNFSYQLII